MTLDDALTRPTAVQEAGPRGQATVARDIAAADLPSVAALLHEGFPSQPEAAFLAALIVLRDRPAAPGMPQFGYALFCGSELVGVLLTMVTMIDDGTVSYLRCNVGCWYVKPAFRVFAPLLVLRSYRAKHVTQFNISAAPHTVKTIAAQGFSPVSRGTFAGVPALSAHGSGARVRPPVADDPLPASEMRMLADHAAFGCVALVCEAGDTVLPFVFRKRRFRMMPFAGAQLIYCRGLADLARVAGPVGRYLARRGLPWVLFNANGPQAGIPGHFFDGKMPTFAKGPNTPRTGDLAYTEAAMFGF